MKPPAVKPLVVITHVDRAVVGLVDEVAEEHDRVPRIVRPYRGEALPDPEALDAVVVLGGPQSAYDDHPYLRDEERFLAEAVRAEVPVLAICLGSQVLARALGGTAQPGERGLEAGIVAVEPTDASATHTSLAGIGGRFFSFHSDSATPPPGAEVLATSDRYVQAWTSGSALALQFHPEMTFAGVTGLLDIEGPKLERYGVDVDAVRHEAQRYFAAGAEDSRVLLHRWFDRVTTDRPATDTREE